MLTDLGNSRVNAYMITSLRRNLSLSFDPTNLVLIIAAIMVFWKLKSVLGQRTGFERPPTVPVVAPELKSNVIDLKPNPVKSEPVWKSYAEQGSALAMGLEAIAAVQNDFSVPEFLAGAKSAYEMILSDFAKGDKQGLKPLLSSTVYDGFAAAIDQHKNAGEIKFFQFVGIKSSKIVNAAMIGKRASIEVAFASEMISATLDKSGTAIEGDSKAITDVSEKWTFERDVSSRDPNWKLVATSDTAE